MPNMNEKQELSAIIHFLIDELKDPSVLNGKYIRFGKDQKIFNYDNGKLVKKSLPFAREGGIFGGRIISKPHNRAIRGHYDHRIGRWVGGIKNVIVFDDKGHHDISGYSIECWFCGDCFFTKNSRKRYCSPVCKNMAYSERRRGDVISKKCPSCGEFFRLKQRRSTTCGKSKCRTWYCRTK